MKSRSTASFAVLAAAAIGTIVLVVVRAVPVEAAYPVERARALVARGLWPRVAGMFRGSAAAAENVRLRREVDALLLVRAEVAQLEAENARLRQTLDYAARSSGRWLAAPVLSRGGGAAAAHETVRVGKGSLAGVAEGAVVVVPEGLVGRVTAVTPHTAEILLVTDPLLKVACEVEGDSAMRGILSGGGDDALLLRHLRGAGRPRPGSRVFTSGRGGVFPRGIEVGALLAVTNRIRGLEGDVRPAVDYSALEDVFIRCAQ